MMDLITRLVRDEEGQGLAEYALILALVAIAVIAVLTFLGKKIDSVFDKVNQELDTAITG